MGTRRRDRETRNPLGAAKHACWPAWQHGSFAPGAVSSRLPTPTSALSLSLSAHWVNADQAGASTPRARLGDGTVGQLMSEGTFFVGCEVPTRIAHMRDFREPACRPSPYMRPSAIHLRPCEVPFAWPLQGRLQGRSYRLAASMLLLLRRAVMALAVGGAVTPDFANFMMRFSAWRSGLLPQHCTATCATRPPLCRNCGCSWLCRECARTGSQRRSHPAATQLTPLCGCWLSRNNNTKLAGAHGEQKA